MADCSSPVRLRPTVAWGGPGTGDTTSCPWPGSPPLPQTGRKDPAITVCRHDKLTAHLRAAGLGAIADLEFVGLDDSGPDGDRAVITGYKAARNRSLTRGQKLSNKALAAVRAPRSSTASPT